MVQNLHSWMIILTMFDYKLACYTCVAQRVLLQTIFIIIKNINEAYRACTVAQWFNKRVELVIQRLWV